MNRKLYLILSVSLLMISSPAKSIAHVGSERYGLADSHHVWRDPGYWHDHDPMWVYRYHPEWAVDEPGWWEADHMSHPEWFEYPFWQEYPIWQYGAYDQYHVWRYADWWHARNPEWVYLHHPEWAGAHAEWLRADHGAHPDWFRSDYWRDHPHDFDHPDSFYRHYALQAGTRGGSHESYDRRNERYGRGESQSDERSGNESARTDREHYGPNARENSPFAPRSRADANAYVYRTASDYRSNTSSRFHPGSASPQLGGGGFHLGSGGGKHH
jgi:hypothetical protein